jgi:hypothetical protein
LKYLQHIVKPFALGFVALLLSSGARLLAADEPSLETQVKAAFLLKFAPFVEWPAGTNQSTTNGAAASGVVLDGVTNQCFAIGILGADPFGTVVDDAAGQEILKGRPIRLFRSLKLAELKECQVIFISDSEAKRLDKLLANLAGRPVLTVSDQPDFARRGGIIGFIKEEGRVRFEINLQAADKAGLKLRAKLLQLGRIIAVESPAGGGG